MFAGIQARAGHRATVDRRGVRIERWWDALDAPRLADAEVAENAGGARNPERLRTRCAIA
jgi:hypothetical protein